MQNKTKKRATSHKHGSTRKRLAPVSVTSWPYYSSFLSKVYVKLKVKEMVMLEFKTDNKPYTPILFTRKTPAIPTTFKGKYVRFIDAGYLEYDVLPLVYSEPELLKCQFRKNLPAITNFNQHRHQLLAQFRKSGAPQTIPEFREFLFQHVKQCNNFRPTLALQLYNYLGSQGKDKPIDAILDFSAGWGDRLFSAAISGRKYIGLDPNANNRRIYKDIIAELGDSSKQRVITTGAEYLDNQDLASAMTELGISKFDLIFTSPPYYDYEIYSAGAQSITNYSRFETWLTYFLFYVILKYVPYLRHGGYVGIYIQDADNKTYLEPLALFVLANSDLLGLTVSGIISATRYPMIIFQKVGPSSSIFPFINKDRHPGKKYQKGELMAMYKKAYPAIFAHNARLRHIYTNGLMDTFKMSVTYTDRDIASRAIFKWVLNLDSRISSIIMTGSLDELNITLAKVCKDLAIKFSTLDNSGSGKLRNQLLDAGAVILGSVQDIPAKLPNQLVITQTELHRQLEPFIKETKNELAVIQLNN